LSACGDDIEAERSNIKPGSVLKPTQNVERASIRNLKCNESAFESIMQVNMQNSTGKKKKNNG